MPLPARGLKGPWAALKAGPRRTMRLHARHSPVDSTPACLKRLLRRGRHAVAGAGSEEPLGGLISLPTSHEATPRPQLNCVGAAACLARLLRVLHAYCGEGAMPLPALGLKSPWAAQKAGPRRMKRHRAPNKLCRRASVSCTLSAAKRAMPLPSLGLKGPRAA
jgi:hypothetical protein